MKRFYLLLFSALLPLSLTHAETILHPYDGDARSGLNLQILKLALSKSAPEITFQAKTESLTEDRMVSDTIAGNLSVFWSGITPQYEQELMPVHIPVLKGMLGHRVFIIKEGNQHLFDNINSLDDLKNLKGGQGTTWGDTLVLKNANLPTVTTTKYPNLFRMLEGDRFDYFPRALHEPWNEVAIRPEMHLTVEKRILLVYPFAMYFLVAPDNKRLHDLIYQGFEEAIMDGSFDKLFYNDPGIRSALDNSNLSERIVFRVPNTNMGPKTPTDRPEFWLKLDEQ
jgi:hypothetical protein